MYFTILRFNCTIHIYVIAVYIDKFPVNKCNMHLYNTYVLLYVHTYVCTFMRVYVCMCVSNTVRAYVDVNKSTKCLQSALSL